MKSLIQILCRFSILTACLFSTLAVKAGAPFGNSLGAYTQVFLTTTNDELVVNVYSAPGVFTTRRMPLTAVFNSIRNPVITGDGTTFYGPFGAGLLLTNVGNTPILRMDGSTYNLGPALQWGISGTNYFQLTGYTDKWGLYAPQHGGWKMFYNATSNRFEFIADEVNVNSLIATNRPRFLTVPGTGPFLARDGNGFLYATNAAGGSGFTYAEEFGGDLYLGTNSSAGAAVVELGGLGVNITAPSVSLNNSELLMGGILRWFIDPVAQRYTLTNIANGNMVLSVDYDNGVIFQGQPFLPSSTGAFDLGDTSHQWRRLYAQQATISALPGTGDYIAADGSGNLLKTNPPAGGGTFIGGSVTNLNATNGVAAKWFSGIAQPTRLIWAGDSRHVGTATPKTSWAEHFTNDFATQNIALATNTALSGANLLTQSNRLWIALTNYYTRGGTNCIVFGLDTYNDVGTGASALSCILILSNVAQMVMASNCTYVAFTSPEGSPLTTAMNAVNRDVNLWIVTNKMYNKLVRLDKKGGWELMEDGIHYNTNAAAMEAGWVWDALIQPDNSFGESDFMRAGYGQIINGTAQGNERGLTHSLFIGGSTTPLIVQEIPSGAASAFGPFSGNVTLWGHSSGNMSEILQYWNETRIAMTKPVITGGTGTPTAQNETTNSTGSAIAMKVSTKGTNSLLQLRTGNGITFDFSTNGLISTVATNAGAPVDGVNISSWLPVNVNGTNFFFPLYK